MRMRICAQSRNGYRSTRAKGTTSGAMAKERLRKIRSGVQFGNIQLRDVREALSDEALVTAEGLLTANDNGVWART